MNTQSHQLSMTVLMTPDMANFSGNVHGGQESTLLALHNVFYHWGSIIVPVGYTDKLLYAAGGNPYGVSFTDGRGKPLPEDILAAARYQGGRVAPAAGHAGELQEPRRGTARARRRMPGGVGAGLHARRSVR